jgi:hypothetical protein
MPWAAMRGVYRLLGLVRRYGAGPVDTACARALDLDVISVMKIASMLEKATENTLPLLPGRGGAANARFARDPAEYATPAASNGTVLTTGGTSLATGRTSPASRGAGLANAGTTPLSLAPSLDTQKETAR